MQYNITGYLCSLCLFGLGSISSLQTGVFNLSSDQRDKLAIHSNTQPQKPTNGLFHNTGRAFYDSGARHIARHGTAILQSGCNMALVADFGDGIGLIEFQGVYAYDTRTGMLVQAEDTVKWHWFPSTGIAFDSNARCSRCGTGIVVS